MTEEKKTCWKECEYANSKAEIIQSYISEKEKVKKLQEEKEELLKSNSQVRSQLRNKTSDYHVLDTHYHLAKEIIEALIKEVKSYEEVNGYDTCELVQKAEAFLKE